MFVGSLGARGRDHLLREVVGNAVDQALAGLVSHISVGVRTDGTVAVADDGPGISIAVGDDGVPFLTRVLTSWRDTPTADAHHPHVHLNGPGMGLPVVCALSDVLEVVTHREGAKWTQRFRAGIAIMSLDRADTPHEPRGTTVTFRPDPSIFSPEPLDVIAVSSLLRDLASLAPGLSTRLDVDDHRRPPGGLARRPPRQLLGRGAGARGARGRR